LLFVAATLGWSGCLLFTDPINKAPVVTLVQLSDHVYRGSPAYFVVGIRDEDDTAMFQVHWHEFESRNQGCSWVTAADWPASLPDELFSSDAPFPFVPSSLDVACLCARTTDRNGASAHACQRIEPQNPTPTASITDLAGAAIASQQPKCSQIQLSAARSQFSPEQPDFPVDDEVEYQWTLSYEGTAPAGRLTQLTACRGLKPPRPNAYQCFYAAVPGVYVVGLTVTDSPAGSSVRTPSIPVSLRITVQEDTPACLVQSSPAISAKWIFLGLGSKSESRTFTVSSVKDDCEPFPPRTDTPQEQQARFVWSVKDGTQGKATWEVQANPANANFFIIDQQSFPNARPGDTIGLRVEARDTPAQTLMAGPACAEPPATDICCGPNGCTGVNDCIRWTTWTVQFQP
jgi:hypothetical protein